jgi:hypothetical protein
MLERHRHTCHLHYLEASAAVYLIALPRNARYALRHAHERLLPGSSNTFAVPDSHSYPASS